MGWETRLRALDTQSELEFGFHQPGNTLGLHTPDSLIFEHDRTRRIAGGAGLGGSESRGKMAALG